MDKKNLHPHFLLHQNFPNLIHYFKWKKNLEKDMLMLKKNYYLSNSKFAWMEDFKSFKLIIRSGEPSILVSFFEIEAIKLETASSDLKDTKWYWQSFKIRFLTQFKVTYIAVQLLAGTAAMHVMRALHTPLQDATFGSGCKLRMHTY